MSEFALGQMGLQLDAPSKGDIVTVRLKPCPIAHVDYTTGRTYIEDQSNNANNFLHTEIWRVVATNGGQAVVEQLTGAGRSRGRRYVWAIGNLFWFEASELYTAMTERVVNEEQEMVE